MPRDALPFDADETCLTQRQLDVLRLRESEWTLNDIATEFDTTTANVSAIERAARDNLEAARRTVVLDEALHATATFTAEAGTDLQDLAERTYETGDEHGLKLDYTYPELTTHLHSSLSYHLDGRRLTTEAVVSITASGRVRALPYPAANG